MHASALIRPAKLLADRGVASRRAAEELIRAGQVRINGTLHPDPAQTVPADAEVHVNGVRILPRQTSRLWRYHKTFGTLVTARDPEGRPTVFDALPKSLPRTVAVGRLDAASEGLLLLTDDGELARYLEHPRTGLPRTYYADIDGPLSQTQIDAIAAGLTVHGVHYAPAAVRIEKPRDVPFFRLEITLREGKNREIRNMMAFFDRKVRRLLRVGYGPFRLGNLAPGDVREVSAADLRPLLLAHKQHSAATALYSEAILI